ncbi:hypothetical protein DES41_110244 [Pseudorhodoferax soli]|uniref:Uncharacterized protein n=1 Tax=Pseudorhodoferax soli TaxID=545864 RepID=A0A368XH02_9BURK|nr:hypothetical protein DES41_110244 [Pseudorhodoferax soli]
MAVGLQDAVMLRKCAYKVLGWCRFGALLMVATLCLSRFSTQSTDGLPTLAAALLTVFAATTSLLYNRARAYSAGPLQRRTLHAAEQCLRATLLLVVGVSAASAVLYWLPDQSGRFFTSKDGDSLVALVLTAPAVMLLAFSGWLYVGALQTLLPNMITPLRTRIRYRRELERRRVKSSTDLGEKARSTTKDV